MPHLLLVMLGGALGAGARYSADPFAGAVSMLFLGLGLSRAVA